MDEEYVLIHNPDHRLGHRYIGRYSSKADAEKVAWQHATDYPRTQHRVFEGEIMTAEAYKAFLKWEAEDIREQEEWEESNLPYSDFLEIKERNHAFWNDLLDDISAYGDE